MKISFSIPGIRGKRSLFVSIASYVTLQNAQLTSHLFIFLLLTRVFKVNTEAIPLQGIAFRKLLASSFKGPIAGLQKPYQEQFTPRAMLIEEFVIRPMRMSCLASPPLKSFALRRVWSYSLVFFLHSGLARSLFGYLSRGL